MSTPPTEVNFNNSGPHREFPRFTNLSDGAMLVLVKSGLTGAFLAENWPLDFSTRHSVYADRENMGNSVKIPDPDGPEPGVPCWVGYSTSYVFRGDTFPEPDVKIVNFVRSNSSKTWEEVSEIRKRTKRNSTSVSVTESAGIAPSKKARPNLPSIEGPLTTINHHSTGSSGELVESAESTSRFSNESTPLENSSLSVSNLTSAEGSIRPMDNFIDSVSLMYPGGEIGHGHTRNSDVRHRSAFAETPTGRANHSIDDTSAAPLHEHLWMKNEDASPNTNRNLTTTIDKAIESELYPPSGASEVSDDQYSGG